MAGTTTPDPGVTTPPTDEQLRPGERWEWGVQHSQGIRSETSERAAREWLELSIKRKRRYDVSAPFLVRRRISNWAPIEPEASK